MDDIQQVGEKATGDQVRTYTERAVKAVKAAKASSMLSILLLGRVILLQLAFNVDSALEDFGEANVKDVTVTIDPITDRECGEVASEDGPIATVTVSGSIPCEQVRHILGCIVGYGCDVTGTFETGRAVEGWDCEAKTNEADDIVYTCTSPEDVVIAPMPPEALSGLAPFVGTWPQHAGSLTVRADGTIEMSMQMYPGAALGPTFSLFAPRTISASNGELTLRSQHPVRRTA